MNEVTLIGTISEGFEFSHEVYGEGFYVTYIQIKRTSNAYDNIKLVVSERLVDVSADLTGEAVQIFGQFRSYNEHCADGKTKLLLYVFVQEIEFSQGEDENMVLLDGYICKQPTFRKTPLGREISDVLLAVNRSYGKSDYIPCICWGRNAKFVQQLPVGTMIEVSGRLQSRDYKKETETHTAYEVSVCKLDIIESD